MLITGGRPKNDRRESDLNRVADQRPDEAPDELVLAKITGATVLGSAALYRWTYTAVEAWMNGTTLATRTNGRNFNTCYSVSELSNGAQFAYGVTLGNLPVGFLPVRIPNDFAVIMAPHRKADGTLVWLIINTQAIDGVCEV